MIMEVVQHLADMIHLAFAVFIGIEYAPVEGPKLIGLGVHVNACHHTNATNNPMRIAAILLPYRIDLLRIALVQHRIIKHHEALCARHNLILHLLPQCARWQINIPQKSVHLVVAYSGNMLGIMRQRVVPLRRQQVLAVVLVAQALAAVIHPNLESRHSLIHT